MTSKKNTSLDDIRPLALVSTAIPYVNAAPHLGYAFEAVITDSLARHRRAEGWQVHHQAGTDDNSLKNAIEAERTGVATQAFVDQNAARFRELEQVLGLSLNAFVRTSSNPRHRETVEWFWRRCLAEGDIYRGAYRGLYCVGCEQFYSEADLNLGRCPEHDRPLEWIEEENYFFRLSRYQRRIAELIEGGTLGIRPQARKKEVLSFVRSGLADFSISRSKERARGWGLPVPGDEGQIIYVWFDALVNYVTGLGPSGIERWQRAERIEHVIGKGILRFHAVYWPALLLSAGLRAPTEISVHGYVTFEGKKLGKSAGNAIDPRLVIDEFGRDATRYYLLRHLRTTRDGDFSRARLSEAHDAELADQLGNLVQRSLTLVARYRDSIVPRGPAPGPDELALAHQIRQTSLDVSHWVEAFALHEALASIWRLIAAGNAYVDRRAPWSLAKRAAADGEHGALSAELDLVLYTLVDLCRCLGCLLLPFLPTTAREILARVGEDAATSPPAEPRKLVAGTRIHPGPPLFPKRPRPSSASGARR